MLKLPISLITLSILSITTANAAELLTGKPKLACEAILCLSTGSPPTECSPSLTEYFSIKKKKMKDTIKERIEFLENCPESDQSGEMKTLVKAIANGAGRCDAASLNATLVGNPIIGQCIQPTLPAYCSAYANHEYTELNNMPIYVKDEPNKPYWPFNNINKNGTSLGNFITINSTNNNQCGHWVNQ